MSIDLTDPELLRNPFAVYSRIREEAELTRGVIPGVPSVWPATRYDDVKLVMSDPRSSTTPRTCRAWTRRT